VPVQRDEVRATRTLMLTLASRIRAAEDPSSTVLTLVHQLLTDGNGPLFAPAAPGALRDALIQATLAMDDGGPGSR
jgi:hypothetical protein